MTKPPSNVSKGVKGFQRGPSLEERFWAKVDKRGPDECWPWTGGTAYRGYGTIYRNGKSERATRISWEIAHGTPFPADKQACHSCDNPPCVNPAHLWPGTMSENLKDAVRKGRQKMPTPPKLTVCRKGHPFTPETTQPLGNGWKLCKICRHAREMIWRRKRKEARAALTGADQ